MSIINFVSGFALKEPEKTTYFIPSFQYDSDIVLDVTILECVLVEKVSGRKYYEGYKAKVTKENLKNDFQWGKEIVYDTDDEERGKLDQDELATKGAIEILKKTFNNSDCYGLTLGSSGEQPRKVEFWRKINCGRNKVSLGTLELQTVEILPSTGKLIEGILLNLQETGEKNLLLQKESEEITKQLNIYKKLADEFKMTQARKEDRLYRAFTHVLNAKKSRIIQLEKQLKQLQNSHNKTSGCSNTTIITNVKIKEEKFSQSPSPTTTTEKHQELDARIDDDSETDYEEESEVHDSSPGDVNDDDDNNQGTNNKNADTNKPCSSKSLLVTPQKQILKTTSVSASKKSPFPSFSTPRRHHQSIEKQLREAESSTDEDIMESITKFCKKTPTKRKLTSSQFKGNNNTNSNKKNPSKNSDGSDDSTSKKNRVDVEEGKEKNVGHQVVSKLFDF